MVYFDTALITRTIENCSKDAVNLPFSFRYRYVKTKYIIETSASTSIFSNLLIYTLLEIPFKMLIKNRESTKNTIMQRIARTRTILHPETKLEISKIKSD